MAFIIASLSFFLITLPFSFQSSLKLGENEFSLKRGSSFSFPFPDSTYYYHAQPVLTDKFLFENASFCSIQQPDPSFTELQKVDIDFSDKLLEGNILIIDNYIYARVSNGSLIAYEINLNKDLNKIDSIIFSQEIPFSFPNETTYSANIKNNENNGTKISNMNNSNNMSNISFISDISNDNNNSNTINKAPSAKPYSNYQLLFSNMTKEILIISNEELQLINLVSTNQKVVLLLNKTLKVNGTVSNAAIIQNFLYLIINFSRIEIYDIRDFFQYNSINLSQLIEFNSTPIVADIAVNSDFLFILENTTNSCFFFDRLGLFLKNTLFFNGTVYNIQVFESTVLIYYLTFDGKLFLKEYLRFNPDSNYFQENNLFEMGSLVKELSFLSRNMLVSCHENLVTFIRHSVKYPKNVTNVLKKTFAYEGIQFLVPAEVTGTMKNESQFLQELVLVSKKGEVNLLMMNPNSGSLVCTPDNNVVTRKYEISMILYYFNCTDRSCSYLKIQSDKLRVVLSIYQELFESSNIALAIGLGIGFSIAFIVTIIFCVYFYRIKHHYTTLVKEISPEETPKIKKPLTDNAEKNEEKKNEEI